jgi:hypothetical protein
MSHCVGWRRGGRKIDEIKDFQRQSGKFSPAKINICLIFCHPCADFTAFPHSPFKHIIGHHQANAGAFFNQMILR